MVIKSVYDRQDDIINSIIELHATDGFECDLTYGNGTFRKNIPPPKYKYDLDPQLECVEKESSTNIKHEDNSLGNVMFDPPFLTYIKSGRDGNGSMVMAKRFGGYYRYDELEEHYKKTLDECNRVIKPKNILVFKCQDIIHNHKMHPTHVNVINWATERNFRLKDLFILQAKNRMVNKNRKQKHARIYHSYFLVLEKLKGK